MYMYGQLYINVHNTFLVSPALLDLLPFSCYCLEIVSWHLPSLQALLLHSAPGKFPRHHHEHQIAVQTLQGWRLNTWYTVWNPVFAYVYIYIEKYKYVYIHRKNLQTSTNSLEKLLNSWSSSPSSRRDERNSWRTIGRRMSDAVAPLDHNGTLSSTLAVTRCILLFATLVGNSLDEAAASPLKTLKFCEKSRVSKVRQSFQLELTLERLLVTNLTLWTSSSTSHIEAITDTSSSLAMASCCISCRNP